ncbi:MAG TPA: transaldolase family protein [Candidatus Limnocylindrales bacterium]|nr:transaldolase family protein [Candidatus Limnocylindrales bacterium]
MVMTAATPLQRTVADGRTDYWNDSCALVELEYAIANGGVGATSNPTIVGEVLKKELDVWGPRVQAIVKERATASDVEICWQVVEEMAVRGAALLEPIFVATEGRKGRLSIQTDPTQYRSAGAMLAQARHFATLAPNLNVKFPTTAAGLEAMEAATADGISINATVSFTVSQALAVGAAVERGLAVRQAAGHDTSDMAPVCTIMMGRLDDWLKAVAVRDGTIVEPSYPDWAGIAVLKRAHALFAARGYRTRLLGAAYRHHLHWSELIGGDVILTMPYAWARRFNASTVEVRPRFAEPVAPAIVEGLAAAFPDFVAAYAEDGLQPAAFDTYGATVRTLRTFIASYHDLVRQIDELMLPNPDLAPAR